MDATPPGEGEAKRRRKDSPAGVAQITGDDALYTIEFSRQSEVTQWDQSMHDDMNQDEVEAAEREHRCFCCGIHSHGCACPRMHV